MKKIVTGFLVMATLLFSIGLQAQNIKQHKKWKKKQPKREVEKEHIKGTFKPTARDEDGDGISDYTDKCPHTPKGQEVTPFGCPLDDDFDGIYNYADNCPNEKGPKENRGCPWGDKDGDLVPDNEDECPSFPGEPHFAGCPDTDKDQIPDAKDACPNQAGTYEHDGCPPPNKDTDGDGLMDQDDLCPYKKGDLANRGCPKLSSEEALALQAAFENLLFETGSDVIKTSSYASLDGLAGVMNKNTSSNLYLEGHTDNQGSSTDNLDLSKRRAQAVKTYLVNKGVSADRIQTAGFGDTKPKASNDTATGRTKNRRVEMTIKYE